MRFPTPYSEANTVAYWDAIRAGNPTHVRMTFAAQDIVLTEADIDIDTGITIDDAFNADDVISIGKVVCKKFSANIIITSRLANFKWVDRFKLEFGVEINSVTKWIVFGFFNGQVPKKTDNGSLVEYIAYDDMYRMDVPKTKEFMNSVPVVNGVVFLGDLFNYICNYTGIKTGTHQWGSACLKSDLKEFKTLKEIVERIAERFGYYIICDNTGTCVLTWFGSRNRYNFDDPVYLTIDCTDEFALKYQEIYNQSGYTWEEFCTRPWSAYTETTWEFITGFITDNTITDVEVIIDDEIEDYTDSHLWNRVYYYITDNVFTRGQAFVADNIYNKLHELGNLSPLEVECIGNWMLEAGDYVDVKITADTTIRVPIFFRTFHWGASCTDLIEVGTTV